MPSSLNELIFYIIYLVLYQIFKLHRKTMEDLAKEYGFGFYKKTHLDKNSLWFSITKNNPSLETLNYAISLFPKKKKNYRNIFNYLGGTYQERKISIYNYQHETSGYAVFEIETEKYLPETIITAKRSKLNNFLCQKNTLNVINANQMETESNEFNKHFKIFFQKDNNIKNELAILEILTPKIMAMLIDEEIRQKGKDIHLEFHKNKIILYKSIRIFSSELSKKDFQRLLSLARKIAK